MRDLLGLGLIVFGAYWFWNQLSVKEQKLIDAEPTFRDRLRATLEESGIRQGNFKNRERREV